MIPLAGFALQGPGDEGELAAAVTAEPLPTAEAEAPEVGGSLPERPPLPVPTVASERGVTPVSGVEA